jgi:hypothetical protein
MNQKIMEYLFKIFFYLFKYFPIINVDLAINNELFFFHAILLILLGLYIYCCIIFWVLLWLVIMHGKYAYNEFVNCKIQFCWVCWVCIYIVMFRV